MSSNATSTDTIVLDTGLFCDRETLGAAIQHLPVSTTQTRKLVPEKMNDGDWDEILNLVLSTKRVITL